MPDVQPPAPTSSRQYDKYRLKGAFHWPQLETSKFYRGRVDAVANFVKPGFNCLDLGCGDAAYFKVLSPLAKTLVGVDADPDGIRWGKKMLGRNGISNATLHCAPFSKARELIGDSRFELVYSMDCVEHLEAPEELISLMHDMGAPRAQALIGTPIFAGKENVSPYHVKEFTIEELRSILDKRFSIEQEIRLPDSAGKLVIPNRFAIMVLRKK